MKIAQTFNFCFRCGNSTEAKQNIIRCSACELVYYINPIPATATLLQNGKGEYLLSKRAANPAKGLWDLPGGFVEAGETLEQGALREIKEEIGIELDGLEYVGSEHDTYDYAGVTYYVVGATFRGMLADGAKLKPDDDVAECKFFLPKDFPMDKIAFPSILKILTEL
jgi:ADP-ribose pyrophosphatase YjhB (NUDIX family)